MRWALFCATSVLILILIFTCQNSKQIEEPVWVQDYEFVQVTYGETPVELRDTDPEECGYHYRKGYELGRVGIPCGQVTEVDRSKVHEVSNCYHVYEGVSYQFTCTNAPYVDLVGEYPTPTPRPTPIPIIPTPEPIPTLTLTPTPTPEPEPTLTPTPTPTPIPTPTPTPTPEPEVETTSSSGGIYYNPSISIRELCRRGQSSQICDIYFEYVLCRPENAERYKEYLHLCDGGE